MNSIEYLLKAYGMAKESKYYYWSAVSVMLEFAWELTGIALYFVIDLAYKLCTRMYMYVFEAG